MKLPKIHSLWIGDTLSNVEKLCIQSFLDNGHEFHLYTYGEVAGIPGGAIVKDGNEIIPADKIFYYKNGSPSGFSNWFRYALLINHGGYWVDMDMVCLRPFDFPQDIVLSYEGEQKHEVNSVGTTVLKFPKSHPLLIALADSCANYKNRDGCDWGAVGGPVALTQFVKQFNMQADVLSSDVFFPIPNLCWSNLYENVTIGFDESNFGVHLWHNIITSTPGFDKNARFDLESFFEKQKSKHGIENNASAKRITTKQLHSMRISKLRINDEEVRRQNKRRQNRLTKLWLALLASLIANLILLFN